MTSFDIYKFRWLAFALLACIWAGFAWNLSISLQKAVDLSVEQSSVKSAEIISSMIRDFREFYSTEVVDKVRKKGIIVTHDFAGKEDHIPLPASASLLLAERLGVKELGLKVDLVSPYPFPWRSTKSLSEYQQHAWDIFERTKETKHYEFSGANRLIYSIPDLMLPSCIGCHNNHPDSPKTDWEIGDVRGIIVLELDTNSFRENANENIRPIYYTQLAFLVLMLAGIILFLFALLRSKQALQKEVILRTKHLEAASNELKEQQNAIDQHAIVSITDLKGNITYANKMFESISGYSRDELIGQNHRIINSGYHNRYFWKEMYRTIVSGAVWNNDVCNRKKNGDLYWVNNTILGLKDENNTLKSYISIRTDITELKAIQAQLIDAKNVADEANRSKSNFLANMSHEIRTPMNGVLGMLDLLDSTELSQDQKSKLDLARNSADTLRYLINDILDFSKIESGKLEIASVQFNLLDELASCFQTMAFHAHAKDLDFLIDDVDIPNINVCGDPVRLRQILINLISNAIKFTPEGKVKVVTSLIPQLNHKHRLLCSVQDTGIGIAAANIHSIFELFTQGDTSTTREYGGTGLGLTICKTLANKMDGDVSAHSRLNEGSRFEFDISLSATEQMDQAFKIDPGINVLIISEHQEAADIMSRQLLDLSITSQIATRSNEAVAICLSQESGQSFDFIFIDLPCNQHDGDSLSGFLRNHERCANSKIFLMVHTSDQYEQYNETIDGTMFKPVVKRDLINIISVATPANQNRPIVENKDQTQTEEIQWSTTGKVLIVDDNAVNQLVAKGMLDNWGLKNELANDGLAALDILTKSGDRNKYCLILMDCQMPNLDGFDATRQIREGACGENYREIPIVAMTAGALESDRYACLRCGMNDYLAKPIDPETMLAILRKWLS